MLKAFWDYITGGIRVFILSGAILYVGIGAFFVLMGSVHEYEYAKAPAVMDYNIAPGYVFRFFKSHNITYSPDGMSLHLGPSNVGINPNPRNIKNMYVNSIKVDVTLDRPVMIAKGKKNELVSNPELVRFSSDKVKYVGSKFFSRNKIVHNYFSILESGNTFDCVESVPSSTSFMHRCRARVLFDKRLRVEIHFSSEYIAEAQDIINGVLKILSDGKRAAILNMEGKR